ncbi:MAG: hypothetical protein ACLQVF_40790 [Isosphaeraceae bacterium]
MAGGLRFSTLGADVADLQAAAADRLLDAEALFAADRFGSAIAMGIYSLEIHLKVRICQTLNLAALPKPFEIHELESLLVLSGLQAARDTASQAVITNWEEIADQSIRINSLRYSGSINWTQIDAQEFLKRLRDPPDGVLSWLSAQP